jgi:c-di-GMP-binding flagellar brake protein YcgR
MHTIEERRFARLHLNVPIRVFTPAGPRFGELRDISLGGAAALFPEKIGEVGQERTFVFPDPHSPGLSLSAKVARQNKSRGGYFVGFRFSNLQREERTALHKFCDHLIDVKGSGARRYTRVARRIPITFKKEREFEGIIEDLSLGGMALIVRETLYPGEKIEVTIPGFRGAPLRIHPIVVYQRRQSARRSDGFRTGMKFQLLTHGKKKRLRQLLRQMTKLPIEKKWM